MTSTVKFVSKDREPIFNVEVKGTIVKFMDDDGMTAAMSKTEFANNYKTEEEWDNLESTETTETTTDEETIPEVAPSANTEQTDPDLFTVVNRINANILADYDMMILDVKPGYRTSIEIVDKQNREVNLTLAHKLLRDNSVLEIATNIAHELIHAYNLLMDIKDTCGGGSYHNDMFKALMDEIGLDAEKTRGQGWGNTVPSSNFIKAIAKLGIDSIILDLPPIESAEDKMAKVRAARATSPKSTNQISLNPNQLKTVWKTSDGVYHPTEQPDSTQVIIIDTSIN
jgi:hypothetical protein